MEPRSVHFFGTLFPLGPPARRREQEKGSVWSQKRLYFVHFRSILVLQAEQKKLMKYDIFNGVPKKWNHGPPISSEPYFLWVRLQASHNNVFQILCFYTIKLVCNTVQIIASWCAVPWKPRREIGTQLVLHMYICHLWSQAEPKIVSYFDREDILKLCQILSKSFSFCFERKKYLGSICGTFSLGFGF